VRLPDEEVELSAMSAVDLAAFMDDDEVLYVIHAMPLTDKQKRQRKSRTRGKGRR
jgi:hypothetical protein